MGSVAETATLAHGFTMADLDNAARKAAAATTGQSTLMYDDRFETAWMAIAEEIYANPGPLQMSLAKTGMRAIAKETNDHLRHHGQKGTRMGEVGANFSKVWHKPSRSQDDFTDIVAERLALPAVLAVLTPAQYEAIAALAAHGTQRRAARALGIGEPAFSARITQARHRALAAWFSPETPRDTSWRHGDSETCRWGHPRAEHSVLNIDGLVKCLACARQNARRAAATESTEQREKRLTRMRDAARARRAAETAEQREERLAKARAYRAKQKG